MAGEDMRDIEPYLVPGTPPDVAAFYATLPERARGAGHALFEDDVVVVDVETTGLDGTHDSIVELAAVRMRGAEVVDRFETLVDPGRRIPEEICELTGISDEDVACAPDPQTAVEQFASFADGCDLVAHNASFDHGFVMRQSTPGSIPGAWLDSLALARIVLPRLKSHRLVDLAAAFGLDAPRHRSMADVVATGQLWRILLAGLHALPAGLAGRIAGISPDTDWPLRKLFSQAAAATPGADFDLRRARMELASARADVRKADAAEVPLRFPTHADIEEAFGAQGVAGAMYPGYERRDEQIAMALQVLDAFSHGDFRALEAGTGVGKSMAYLLPSALIARDNGITMGVATKTNALMDQLVYHELPRLSAALGGLGYIALKGYDHYPCLRKLDRFSREADSESEHAIEMTAMLLVFATQAEWGDLDAVNLHWSGLPRMSIQCSPLDCLKNRCPFFPKRCFLHGARRAANSADIVVTNHALLFRNLQADNGILPPIRHWVVDEAHAAESEARRQLSFSATARDLDMALDRLVQGRSSAIAHVRRKAAEVDGGDILYGATADIVDRVGQIRSVATSFFSFVKDLASFGGDSFGSYDRTTMWVGPELRASGPWACLQSPGHSLVEKLDGLVKHMRDLLSSLEQFEGAFASQEADLANSASAIAAQAEALALVLDGSDDAYVYSVELDRNPDRVAEALHAQMLDIGQVLDGELYPGVQGLVYTSATLSTGSGGSPFAHFEHATGLDRLDPVRHASIALASSYDFEHQMRIFLPTDMPEPNARGYHDALAALLLDVHRAMDGSVLTLFTNRREMESLYHELKPQLAADGLELAAQLRGTSPKNLRDRFLADERLSLFALRSFWEGFDAPGSTLRCVVIPKLPFGLPSDPLAREREAREGSVAWRRYALPEAIMDLKQAAGRLIRSATDSGYLVLADARLQTKSYGKQFLQAMPTSDIRRATTADVARQMREANGACGG